jgi:hypothetical protein
MIVAARRLPALRVVGLIASTGLVALAAWMIWSALLFFQVVRIDPLLRRLGVYRLEQPWAGLLFLGPPMVAAAVFALLVSRRWRRDR